MWIEKSEVKVWHRLDGKPLVVIDPDDFRIRAFIDIKVTVEIPGQPSGRITEEDRMEQFFESAMPMLVKMWEKIR